jgi:CubicO group peptidase (beta-lactamase class C family)
MMRFRAVATSLAATPTRLTLLSIGLCACLAPAAHADEVDDVIQLKMKEQHIPGISIAVVEQGKIVREQAYGFADVANKVPVTTQTRFQAASVSKPVSAMGALHLVETKHLSLDANINTQMSSWQLPDNDFTQDRKVTLRDLLSHSAGINVGGFHGYAADTPVPSLKQVLDGVAPANSEPIRVDTQPGSKWRYSGGGYVVVQQMVIDQASKPFPTYMAESVLGPFHMNSSSFEQFAPLGKGVPQALAYDGDGKPVAGGWHRYPELAAAGLWTTAGDLGRFVIGVQQAYTGAATPVISKAMAQSMLGNQINNDGLGVFVNGSGDALRFTHSGRNVGYDSYLRAYANTGNGLVILMNTNNDGDATAEIAKAIAHQYHWPLA